MRLINDQNWRAVPREQGMIPRRLRRGSKEAEACGAVPLIERPDIVIPWDEMKERIREAHEKKTMPIDRWKADEVEPKDQARTNLCWAYGATSAIELFRTLEAQPYRRLGPASLGWLVDWRNAGNYLLDTIRGIAERGIASSAYVPDGVYTPDSFKENWEEDALRHRVPKWFDAGGTERLMAQHCASMLIIGQSGYNAYNWWGHATGIVGVEWVEGILYNLRWDVLNSHGDGIIQLEGSRGVPDEVYFPITSTFAP